MSITVILTTCNRPYEMVKRAVDSVLAQTELKDTQLIIVNDYPKDRALSKKIEGLIGYSKEKVDCIYIEMPDNMGACAARNRGAMEATGDYLAFLDDDDIWMPEKLKMQIDYINNHDVILVTGPVEEHLNGRVIVCNRNPKPNEDIMEKLLEYNIVGGCSVPLISKSAFKKVGGFDTKYQSSQDYNLWLKLLKIGNIGFIDKPLIIYETDINGITGNIKGRKQGWNMLLEDFKSDYRKYPISRKNFCYTASLVMKEKGRMLDSLLYKIRGKLGI